MGGQKRNQKNVEPDNKPNENKNEEEKGENMQIEQDLRDIKTYLVEANKNQNEYHDGIVMGFQAINEQNRENSKKLTRENDLNYKLGEMTFEMIENIMNKMAIMERKILNSIEK